MLFFKCRASFNELVALEKNLPEELYCISNDRLEGYHYGVIKVTIFNKLLNVLTGETLEQLEYLSDDEFREALVLVRRNNISFSGNTELLLE